MQGITSEKTVLGGDYYINFVNKDEPMHRKINSWEAIFSAGSV